MTPERSRGQSPAQIADHNSRTILEALRRTGPMTRNDLTRLVGLTVPGITNITRRLLADGLILEDRRRSPNAQIPSAHYFLNPDGAFAIGARRRAAGVEAVLIDLLGTIRARTTRANVAAAVAALEKAAGKNANIVGTGFAYDDSAGADGIALSERATITATLAETTLGQGAPENGLAMLLIEERIRAGLFFNGQPFAGVHGDAGRIGEMRTGDDRRLLDEVASAASFRTAGTKPAAVNAWTKQAALHLFDAVFALTGFLAPDRIHIAGDLPPEVIDALIAEMHRLNAGRQREPNALVLPAISPATYGSDSVLVGAALLPFFARLLPSPLAG